MKLWRRGHAHLPQTLLLLSSVVFVICDAGEEITNVTVAAHDVLISKQKRPTDALNLAQGHSAAATATAASAGTRADSEDSSGVPSDDALSYIQNRFFSLRQEAGLLHHRLLQAVQWGRHEEQLVTKGKAFLSDEKQKIRHFLARKALRVRAVLAAERRRERGLDERLRNASRAVEDRGVALAALQRRLDDAGRAADERARGWRSEEAQLRQAAADAEGKAASSEDRLRRVQAADVRKELEANSTAKEREQVLQATHKQVAQLSLAGAHLRDQLAKETELASSLQGALATKKHELEELVVTDQRLRGRSAELRRQLEQRSGNLTAQLRASARGQRELQQERDMLKAELLANSTQASSLASEAASLRRQLAEERAARRGAEAAAKSAGDAAASAQALARQLSGAVPQLLDQARQERALRTRTQDAATQQVEHLEQTYAEEVQRQADMLRRPLAVNESSSGATAALPSDLAVVSGPASLEGDAEPEGASPSAASPDLADDSHGLGQLLTQDDADAGDPPGD